MTFEDFGKFLNRMFLISLDRINGAALVRFVYLLGMAAAVILGLNHFFATFRTGIGDGLWGILEIIVFGLFGLALLRVVCEALIVYFAANKSAIKTASRGDTSVNLIDEVRDAIEQLGDDEDEKDSKSVGLESARTPAQASAPAKPAALSKSTASAKASAPAKTGATKTTAAKAAASRPASATAKRTPRTAKRTPKPKAGAGEG